MLPSKNRLNKKSELSRLWKNSSKQKSIFFLLRHQPGKTPHNRFAIFVPTGIDKRSTARNRLRRQIREILRANLDNLEKKPRKDVIVLLLKKPKEEKYFNLLKDDLEKCLKQLF